jgi:hypothetical protein
MSKQPRRKTAERYHVSVRTIERWASESSTTGYPSWAVTVINGRNYDDTNALDAWDAECAAKGRSAQTPPAAGRGRVSASP